MKQKGILTAWIVFGSILALGPLWGHIGTVIGMIRAFGQLGAGSPEVGELAQDISLALYTTAAGIVMCVCVRDNVFGTHRFDQLEYLKIVAH